MSKLIAPKISQGPLGIRKAEDGTKAIFDGSTGEWLAVVVKTWPKPEGEAWGALFKAAPALAEAVVSLLHCMDLAGWEGDPAAQNARAALLAAGCTESEQRTGRCICTPDLYPCRHCAEAK